MHALSVFEWTLESRSITLKSLANARFDGRALAAIKQRIQRLKSYESVGLLHARLRVLVSALACDTRPPGRLRLQAPHARMRPQPEDAPNEQTQTHKQRARWDKQRA
jgi:hypothetical protein